MRRAEIVKLFLITVIRKSIENRANKSFHKRRSGWVSLARSGFFSLFPQVDQQRYFIANMNHKNLFSEENRKTHCA